MRGNAKVGPRGIIMRGDVKVRTGGGIKLSGDIKVRTDRGIGLSGDAKVRTSRGIRLSGEAKVRTGGGIKLSGDAEVRTNGGVEMRGGAKGKRIKMAAMIDILNCIVGKRSGVQEVRKVGWLSLLNIGIVAQCFFLKRTCMVFFQHLHEA
jgi:hypothetical protein